MLTNKKIIISLLFTILLALSLIYWFYLAKPKPFYSERTLKHIINESTEMAFAKEIQDIIYIDQKHVYVPIISKRNEYGVSFWKWEHHKWKVVSISNKGGMPTLWKINPHDPASYAMFWNYSPDDHVYEIKIRFLRSRGFQVSDNINYYTPKIQMEKRVSLKNKTYGYFKYPQNWVEIQKLEQKIESSNKSILDDDAYPTSISLSMTTYDKVGKEIFPENSINGIGYTFEDDLFDNVIEEDDHQVENRNY
ncbi:hypothetical protein [Bacillus sp. EAC]|uniref:hypothetical protein n=1 Tax=Bacillus sp. EAC TaxID=1978338 RepID=UPI000B435AEE|nr:hypothetical protein [Bacillus sp. EAC]